MLTLSPAAIIEKNRLGSADAWLILLQITMPDGVTVIRVVRNTADVTWPASGGNLYVAFTFELDEIGETSKNEVPQVAVRVGNVTRALQAYLEAGGGGVGAEIVFRVVHSAHLDLTTPEVELTYSCTGCKSDATWVTFTLGAANPYLRRFPRNRLLKNNCRWRFKSTDCGYAGASTSCDKTLLTCRALGNSARYGGFPAVGRGGFYA